MRVRLGEQTRYAGLLCACCAVHLGAWSAESPDDEVLLRTPEAAGLRYSITLMSGRQLAPRTYVFTPGEPMWIRCRLSNTTDRAVSVIPLRESTTRQWHFKLPPAQWPLLDNSLAGEPVKDDHDWKDWAWRKAAKQLGPGGDSWANEDLTLHYLMPPCARLPISPVYFGGRSTLRIILKEIECLIRPPDDAGETWYAPYLALEYAKHLRRAYRTPATHIPRAVEVIEHEVCTSDSFVAEWGWYYRAEYTGQNTGVEWEARRAATQRARQEFWRRYPESTCKYPVLGLREDANNPPRAELVSGEESKRLRVLPLAPPPKPRPVPSLTGIEYRVALENGRKQEDGACLFVAGQPMFATCTVSNKGQTPCRLLAPGQRHARRWIVDNLKEPVPIARDYPWDEAAPQPPAAFVTLQPGQELSAEVDLSLELLFPQEGVFAVTPVYWPGNGAEVAVAASVKVWRAYRSVPGKGNPPLTGRRLALPYAKHLYRGGPEGWLPKAIEIIEEEVTPHSSLSQEWGWYYRALFMEALEGDQALPKEAVREAWQEVLMRFPDGECAPRARKRLEALG